MRNSNRTIIFYAKTYRKFRLPSTTVLFCGRDFFFFLAELFLSPLIPPLWEEKDLPCAIPEFRSRGAWTGAPENALGQPFVSLCFAQKNSLIDWTLGLNFEEHLFRCLNLKIREFGYSWREGGRAPTWKQLFHGGGRRRWGLYYKGEENWMPSLWTIEKSVCSLLTMFSFLI